MPRYFTVLIVLFCFWNCTSKETKIAPKDSVLRKTNFAKLARADTLDEEFIDSTHIGLNGHFKLELRKYRTADSFYVKIDFFEKRSYRWIKKQELSYNDCFLSCDVELADFNNDGLKDMTFQSVVAARGANEVRKLFIFNKTMGKLIFIKNSEDYPNMQYNKKLNCIDALLVSGSWNTVFLHLEKDSLREFASVDVRGNILNLTVTDRNGKERDLIVDKKIDNMEMFPRFKNFSPLELANGTKYRIHLRRKISPIKTH